MAGALIVFRKELGDHLVSQRIYIIALLVYLISISMTYSSIMGLWGNFSRSEGENLFLKLFTSQQGLVPSFLGFIAFFGPLIGLILVFDAVNRESNQGSMGLVLSQPIHKDSMIIGKFAATVATVMLILSTVFIFTIGMGMATLGAFPTLEEMTRITVFLIFSGVYLSFWIGLGLLYSIYFRREGTSALASIATWLFFTLFYYMIADFLTNVGASSDFIVYTSPSEIYLRASSVIMEPLIRVLGPVSYEKMSMMLASPLSIGDSLLIIWPHLTALTAGMIIIFIVSYIGFIRQEIRST